MMSEVDEEILKIWRKKNEDNTVKDSEFCNGNNLEACLKHLTQEFDYLDVSCLEEPLNLTNSSCLRSALVQLINSSYNLLHLHKESQKKHEKCLEIHSRLSSDARTLTKTVTSLRNEIASKNKQLHLNKEKIVLDRLEITELRNKVTDAKKEINVVRKESISEKVRHAHELQRILSESRRLEGKFRKNCGDYTSKEGHIVALIDELKKNETKHLEMIEKLQQNNHELFEQVVKLKEELEDAKYAQE